MYGYTNQPAGAYSITEQGDLGLGLNLIDESALKNDEEEKESNTEKE